MGKSANDEIWDRRKRWMDSWRQSGKGGLAVSEKLMEVGKGGGESRADIAFRENIRRLVGNGNRTLFWKEVWLGERPLKDVFPRLYRVVREKDAVMSDRYRLEGNRAQ